MEYKRKEHRLKLQNFRTERKFCFRASKETGLYPKSRKSCKASPSPKPSETFKFPKLLKCSLNFS